MSHKVYDRNRFFMTIKEYDTVFPAYLIYGDENYLVKQGVKALTSKVTSLYPDVEIIRLKSQKFDVDSLVDAICTVGFFANYKLIIVQDIDVKKLSDSDSKKLVEAMSELEECTVVFSFETEPFPAKPTAKIKKIVDKISEIGAVVKFVKPEKRELVEFAYNKFSEANIPVDRSLCDYLINRIGQDMNQVSSECNKLIAYVGSEKLTKQAIDAVTIQDVTASVFEITKRILRHDTSGALSKLGDLFILRNEPVAILAAISSGYVDLYRAKVAKMSGVVTAQAVTDFGYKGRDFRIKNAMRDVGGISIDKLCISLDLIRETDRKLKSEDIPKTVLMELLVTKLSML